MKKTIVNNKSLNILLKNAKKKPYINDINKKDIIAQYYNINGNYKCIYYFDDEIDTVEEIGNQFKNKKHFRFKDLDYKENIIKEEMKTEKNIELNNIKPHEIENYLSLKEKAVIENENILNIREDEKNIKAENNNEKNIYVNNSYKIINESKYNNKSKITICLINNNNNNNL